MTERADHCFAAPTRRRRAKLHALISANLDEGHLLPRALDELTLHADAVRRRDCAAAPSSAAPSWRRSARRSPRSARWRSTRRRAARRRRVDARRRAAPARAPRRLRQAVRVHPRARLLQPDGLLDRAAPLGAGEDVHRLREVSAVPQLRTVRDGRCRSMPAADSGRSRLDARRRPPRMTALDARTARNDRGRRHHAAGLPGRRRQRRHQGEGRSISRCSSRTGRRRRRRSSPPTGRRRRRSSCRASISRAPAASRARSSSTAAAPTPAPATTGCEVARDMAAETARARRLSGRAGAGRVDRRHRRRARASTRSGAACPTRMAALGRRSGRAGGAGDHDDRSVSEGSGGARVDRRPRRRHRRHGQGLRHDRADDGDDARRSSRPMPRCRRRCSTGRCAKSSTTPSTPSPSTASARPTTASCCSPTARAASPSTSRATTRSRTRCGTVCLRLALGIVRGGEGATKLVTVTVTGAASAAEARRAAKAIANSPLVKTAIHGGDPNWGRLIAVAGPRRCRVRAVARRGRRSARSCSSRMAGRTTKRRRRRRSTCKQRRDRASWSISAPGTASSTVWTCDLSAEYVRINAEYRT